MMHNNDVKAELGKNFIEYAAAVNTDRAIPDAKSGLKPVAKRILWSAYEEGRTFNKPHVKSARIVGDVMGKYHPHGDSSIYGAMVRLSQNWVLRYPLIDWHGSNGNIAGDGPAAARYTEARLSKLAEDGMLQGLKKKNVDFIDNYDETLDEPVTLPAIFPNLLCNPNTGIGVAMACSWLPHNLKEVANAIFDFMDEKEPMLPGPDFPTGGIIINSKDIPKIMRTGHGSVKVRGRYKIEKDNTIIFYEIPYGQTIEGLLNEIGAICDAKEINGILEAHDESNKKGIRIVIKCDKDVNPETVVNQLYLKTNLQTSISYSQVALIDKTPTELNLKDCCKIYVDHNIDCLIKELNFDLAKASARLHIVEGLLICLEDIDNVIELIKKSENSAAAKANLIQKYGLTEEQAKAVLAIRLSSLTHMEKMELESEKKELISTINEINDTLVNKTKQKAVIRNRLSEIVNKYGDERRTELQSIENKNEDVKPAVEAQDVIVTVSKTGYFKRTPREQFKLPEKKKVKSQDEVIVNCIEANTVDALAIFTDQGKMYKLSVNDIPECGNSSKGTSIYSLTKIDSSEKIVSVLAFNLYTQYAVFFTKNGLIKKTNIEEFLNSKKSTGLTSIKLRPGDTVANVVFMNDEDVIIITRKGMGIHVETKDIAPIKRNCIGVKGMMAVDDEVICGLPFYSNSSELAILTIDGYGKRISVKELPWQLRDGKGLKIAVNEIVNAAIVAKEDNIIISGTKNIICIKSNIFPILSRAAIGNKVIDSTEIMALIKY